MIFEKVPMRVQPGDIISSKKGILMRTTLTGEDEFYVVKALEYLGNGGWRVIGEKERVDAKTGNMADNDPPEPCRRPTGGERS